jgi:Domain of unknown function (DUF4349)
MDTEIEFLRRLEGELTTVAHDEERRRMSVPRPARRGRAWRSWAGAAAALIALAGIIGLVAQPQGRNASMAFSSVGSAVNEPRPPDGAGAKAADESGTPTISSVPNETQTGLGSEAAEGDLSKIIRDGQVALTIEDGSFRSNATQVSRIATSNGGSVLSSSTSGGESGSFTLRIPAANFERAMAQLFTLGTLDSSEVHGQDVTAQYVDLKAHMKIYLSRRKVLFGLMNQADTIGETLTVQRELDDVQLKIDQIQGQLNYINKQVAVATIKVDMHEPDAAVAAPPGDVENPSLARAWDHAVQGFLNVLAAVLIGLGYLVPIAVVVGIGYWITRSVKRRRAADTG